ncbi:protein FAR1-RELATED SEQUENCE 5-like [Silene latifolia]|uniref:protein FAR1-RELATED SEQUENCE 5-like n=1 Tax=Silene latifolia TaxID=37657 RepID=UPI003D77EAD7
MSLQSDKSGYLRYFRDLPLGCLLRTTQRSESSNSYFKRFESHFGTLVEFWMRYNSAIEQQRHTQRRMDNANEHSMLEKVGPMKVEIHASLVYTHPIFGDFQNEVKHAICSTNRGIVNGRGKVEYHDVRDGPSRSFRVEFNTKTNENKCACKLFERHALSPPYTWVWNGRRVHGIPDPYVLARWTKKSSEPIVRDENGKEIEALLGITTSNDIDLRPPNKAKNKGSGKRLRSSKEKAKSKPQKRKRRCGNCKKWVNHNKRTCNLPFLKVPFDDDDEEESKSKRKWIFFVEIDSVRNNSSRLLNTKQKLQEYESDA